MFSCRHLVRNVSFFKDASTEFIYNIVSRLKFQVYFPREIIIHAGMNQEAYNAHAIQIMDVFKFESIAVN